MKRRTGCEEKIAPAGTVPASILVIQERIEALAAKTETLESEHTEIRSTNTSKKL